MMAISLFGGRRGHRAQPHTADLMIEAWGSSRTDCLEEAALGLVEAFADAQNLVPNGSRTVRLGAADDEEILVELLDEIVYLVDTLSLVPITVTVRGADGGLCATFGTVPADAVVPVGAIPKGISRSELFIGKQRGRWRCRVEVDV
jgi:SHS2 domain-containing protein